MESLSVSEFKSKCLSILQDVNKQKKRVVITKRGKPIAEVIPADPGEKEIPLKDTVIFMGDIISPVAPSHPTPEADNIP
jgi:prevent-host-death family protein